MNSPVNRPVNMSPPSVTNVPAEIGKSVTPAYPPARRKNSPREGADARRAAFFENVGRNRGSGPE
jgi:hypothetical protein